VYRFLVPKGKRVLELGCAQGDLLAALEPAVGVGVDFSAEMINRAAQKHPKLRFIQADVHDLELDERFDIIILSDLVNDLWDAQKVFNVIERLSTPRTRVIINFYSHVWAPVLGAAQRLGLSRPNLSQNWFTLADISGLLSLANFEVIQHRDEVLVPLPLGPLSAFANRFMAKVKPFSFMALTHVLVARPTRLSAKRKEKPVVSVIVPAWVAAPNWSLSKAAPATKPMRPSKLPSRNIPSAAAS
jgi:ubiquinone/menaquinone biosynthesis C-methylase UbiE